MSPLEMILEVARTCKVSISMGNAFAAHTMPPESIEIPMGCKFELNDLYSILHELGHIDIVRSEPYINRIIRLSYRANLYNKNNQNCVLQEEKGAWDRAEEAAKLIGIYEEDKFNSFRDQCLASYSSWFENINAFNATTIKWEYKVINLVEDLINEGL